MPAAAVRWYIPTPIVVVLLLMFVVEPDPPSAMISFALAEVAPKVKTLVVAALKAVVTCASRDRMYAFGGRVQNHWPVLMFGSL